MLAGDNLVKNKKTIMKTYAPKHFDTLYRMRCRFK
jgi:hypothetical protein